jgi:hypothetical protein
VNRLETFIRNELDYTCAVAQGRTPRLRIEQLIRDEDALAREMDGELVEKILGRVHHALTEIFEAAPPPPPWRLDTDGVALVEADMVVEAEVKRLRQLGTRAARGWRTRLCDHMDEKAEQLGQGPPPPKPAPKPDVDAELKREVAALRKEVEELRRTATTRYRGVWSSDAHYRRGDLATHKGALWHCWAEHTEEKPGSSSAWQLTSKSQGGNRAA